MRDSRIRPGKRIHRSLADRRAAGDPGGGYSAFRRIRRINSRWPRHIISRTRASRASRWNMETAGSAKRRKNGGTCARATITWIDLSAFHPLPRYLRAWAYAEIESRGGTGCDRSPFHRRAGGCLDQRPTCSPSGTVSRNGLSEPDPHSDPFKGRRQRNNGAFRNGGRARIRVRAGDAIGRFTNETRRRWET